METNNVLISSHLHNCGIDEKVNQFNPTYDLRCHSDKPLGVLFPATDDFFACYFNDYCHTNHPSHYFFVRNDDIFHDFDTYISLGCPPIVKDVTLSDTISNLS